MRSNTQHALALLCEEKTNHSEGCLNMEFRGLVEIVDYTAAAATGQLWSGPDLPLIP